MTDESDYSVMLNAFAQAGLQHGNDPEGHRSIQIGRMIFWFDDKQNLVRIERPNRVIVCRIAKENA